MADLRRCLVSCSVVVPGVFGRAFGVGASVDLDERVGEKRLRDFVDAAWFEPVVATPDAPVARRKRSASPSLVAREEE